MKGKRGSDTQTAQSLIEEPKAQPQRIRVIESRDTIYWLLEKLRADRKRMYQHLQAKKFESDRLYAESQALVAEIGVTDRMIAWAEEMIQGLGPTLKEETHSATSSQ